jgi:hypothetical protein
VRRALADAHAELSVDLVIFALALCLHPISGFSILISACYIASLDSWGGSSCLSLLFW